MGMIVLAVGARLACPNTLYESYIIYIRLVSNFGGYLWLTFEIVVNHPDRSKYYTLLAVTLVNSVSGSLFPRSLFLRRDSNPSYYRLLPIQYFISIL